MNHPRHHLWTWLSISLYGGMVLAIQALHTHDGDGCGSGCCVLGVETSRDSGLTGAGSLVAENEDGDRPPVKPFSPHEDDCPACQFVMRPKTLAHVDTAPEIGEFTEVLSSPLLDLYVSPASQTPHARGPPTN